MSDIEIETAPQPITLQSLAAQMPGSKMVGNGNLEIRDLAHPKMVTGQNQAVLILDADALKLIPNTQHPVKAAVVAAGISVPEGLLEGYLVVERPRFALVKLLSIFEKPLHSTPGIHPSAIVESSAMVAPDASIGAFVYVGANVHIGGGTIVMPHVTIGADARVGEKCVFHPGARVGERVIIGNNVILHHNASIGADGFSYVTPEAGSVESARSSGGQVTAQNKEIFKINSIGTVILEDNVEVGACATIDRSNLGATMVRKGTKIDNLVMVGHNNSIGENCLIVSQVGLSGSCEIGDRVVIAGQAGLADHLKVGNDAIIMAKSGVMRDIADKEVVVGIPALPRRETLQNVMYIGRLKELFQEVKTLKKRVAELEANPQEQDKPKVGV
jgi:UDP-3-O-[3-hydroxymyristoyl] glucosamine N-acyltransferase